jgi:ferrous iron transporter FeoB
MTLNQLSSGQRAIIVKVKGRGAFLKRLSEMGFVRGHIIEPLITAPLKDPIIYKILDSEVSLRNADAALIQVIPINEADKDKDYSFGYSGVMDNEDDEQSKSIKKELGTSIDIVLVGNPNSGKTSLFNAISGAQEKVGNYSGITVDAKKIVIKYKDYTLNLIDLPGTYSISAYSPEERYVRDYIFNKIPDVVINVVDGSNLNRNLFLTTQLIDMDIKVVMALNFYDELQERGDRFDYSLFAGMVGIPIIPTIAPKKKGIEQLFDTIIQVYNGSCATVRHVHINYGETIERCLGKLSKRIKESKSYSEKVAARYYAIRLLEKDKEIINAIESWQDHKDLHEVAQKAIRKIETTYQDYSETVITEARYGFISGALKETYYENPYHYLHDQAHKEENKHKEKDYTEYEEKGEQIRSSAQNYQKHKSKTDKIDSILLHPVLGYPIFFFILWLMFYCTFTLGQYPMKWMQCGVDWISSYVGGLLPQGAFNDLITQGIIGGVGGVIVFLPNILILFLFISLMEDSGYMSRVAFLMDKIMHKIGLHGKSFVPLIMGFGCNVPAIMATRTLEDRKDRLLTMLIIPFMSCSARLPVYVVIVGTFFPHSQVLVFCMLYLAGMALAVLFALLFRKTLFRGKGIPFVMEQPPYRIPTPKAVINNISLKIGQYLKKIGGIILLASVLLWCLSYFPQRNTQQIEQSYIASIGKVIEPAMKPLGFDWKTDVALLAGVSAKEVVVSTMGVLYSDQTNTTSNNLGAKLKAAKYASGAQIDKPVFSKPVALSLLVFVLAYFPCIGVFSAVSRESRWRWAIFLALYTTIVAYILAFVVYHIALLI